jgi:threonine synthase
MPTAMPTSMLTAMPTAMPTAMRSHVQPDAILTATEWKRRMTTGLWRHARWLPEVAPEQRISLGEGDTPLVRLPRWGEAHGLRHLYAKLEFISPTSSFKDRGMAVLVSVARQEGATHLVEDSSGNAGAAAAAYAARAGMRCTVYAPAAAPAAKLRQIEAYGAELVSVPGPRAAVAEAAREAGASPGSYHVSHNDNPLFVAGNKTLAYELGETLDQMDFGTGAWHLVMPVGGGALFCGAWLGFQDLHASGMLPATRRPRLHAAQSSACPPIAVAWERGEAAPAEITRQPSVCGGIEIERPARGADILRAIRESGGSAVASDEPDILAQRDALARLEGVYAEPTSAAALAGLARLARQGRIAPDDVVVVAITGSGLKDPGR